MRAATWTYRPPYLVRRQARPRPRRPAHVPTLGNDVNEYEGVKGVSFEMRIRFHPLDSEARSLMTMATADVQTELANEVTALVARVLEGEWAADMSIRRVLG